MKNHTGKVIITLFIIISAALLNAKAQTNEALPTLRGEEAVNQLKQTGQYDSLMEAVKQSREKDGQTNEPTTEDAIGQSAKLLASDRATGDYFGNSVAVSGDTAVIGAYLEDTAPNTNNGAAYVFVRSGTAWTQQAKLLASDPATDDFFGYSVGISGDTIVVGAYAEDTAPNTGNGAAYVFVRSGTTWTEQAKLLASDAATADQFGWSVGISGDTVIVGAYLEDTAPNFNNGAAYVFVRSGTTWTEQAKLLASDAAAGDQFGWSVAISGDTIVIGARTEDTAPNSNNGAAYVFVRSGATWSEQTKLLASDPATSDFFGYSVAISGDTIIIGAVGVDTAPNTENGAAYVFVRSGTTWSQQAKLLASDAAGSDQFGWSVAVSDDTIVVGANQEDTAPNTDNGAAYVFVRSGTSWSQQAKLLASDPAASDNFGSSVAISNNVIVVGALSEDTAPNTDNGATYAFRFLSNNWTQEAKKVATDGAASDELGYSVAISGDTAVVGAYVESTTPNTTNGAAYVFVRSGTSWSEQAKLLASDPASQDRFGWSVAISGDTIVVGAYQEDTAPNGDNGAAYVFVRSGTTWSQQQKLLASDAASDDYFGISVGISGETIVVGAYREDTAPNSQNGAAYVFVRSGVTWSQQAKLLASDPATSDFFGHSVAISGDTIVVGANGESTAPNSFNGAAYVFVRSGASWTQQQKLLASDAATNDTFGQSVGISGDTIVVGAFFEGTAPNAQNGAAYVFVRSGTTWSQQQKLLASDAASDDYFGISVGISGETIVVGAYWEDTAPNTDNGAAYVFTRTGTIWAQTAKLTDNSAASSDRFGTSVAVSGDKIVVGAPFSDVGTVPLLTEGASDNLVPQATDQGAALFFVNSPLAPNAANVSISGRVTTTNGAGVRNAVVILTDGAGNSRTVRTGTFGYYRFDDLEAGETYIISVSSKRFTFTAQIVTANDNVTDFDFIALE